LKNVRTPATWD